MDNVNPENSIEKQVELQIDLREAMAKVDETGKMFSTLYEEYFLKNISPQLAKGNRETLEMIRKTENKYRFINYVLGALILGAAIVDVVGITLGFSRVGLIYMQSSDFSLNVMGIVWLVIFASYMSSIRKLRHENFRKMMEIGDLRLKEKVFFAYLEMLDRFHGEDGFEIIEDGDEKKY